MSSLKVGNIVTCSRLSTQDFFRVASSNTNTGEVNIRNLTTGQYSTVYAALCKLELRLTNEVKKTSANKILIKTKRANKKK